MDDGRRQHVHGKDVLPELRATGCFNVGIVWTERPCEAHFLLLLFFVRAKKSRRIDLKSKFKVSDACDRKLKKILTARQLVDLPFKV